MTSNENAEDLRGRLAPEEVVLDAMGAYEGLARCAIMRSRGDGLSKTQTDIIIRLSFCGKSSMTSLADDLAVSKEHVTRAVNALIERGLVEKHRSTENFRLVKASLTEEGTAMAHTIRMASIERLNERLAKIPPEDREALLEASEQAQAIINKILTA